MSESSEPRGRVVAAVNRDRGVWVFLEDGRVFSGHVEDDNVEWRELNRLPGTEPPEFWVR